MRLTVAEIAQAADGQVIAGDEAAVATSYSIDSRTLAPGACFAALVAKRDGHDYVPDAFERGATVALVAHAIDLRAGSEPRALVRVGDPLVALAELGRLARDRLVDTTVVGITGSAGKTTTKDLLAAALGRARRVVASPGSFNNEAGLPLTLLAADTETEVVVAEMGARLAGNIADLCAIARPRLGILTNVGLAHAGRLGGRAGVAAVKGELLEALPADGVAVLDADDDVTADLARRTAARVLRIGRGPHSDCDVRITEVVLDDDLRPSFHLDAPAGSLAVRLRLRGEHQVMNAAMAAAVALELGVAADDVVAGLSEAEAAPWRMQLAHAPGGITVLNDAYNASPTSTDVALRALARLPTAGRRWAVLGEMLELGAEAEPAHTAVGRQAADCGVDVVVVVGDAARAVAEGARSSGRGVEIVEVPDVATAYEVVAARVGPGDAVLVKASRAVGLERVADALAGLEAVS